MKKPTILDKLKDILADILGGTTQKQPTHKAPQKTETYVFVTVKGKKFHYDRLCPGLRNSKDVKMGLSKARKAGYTACDKCCYSYLHK